MMTIFGILILVMALFLVITILLQSSRDHRLSGTIAGGAETFFGKQKGKTMDGVLNKITIAVCIVFFVCVLLMYIFQGADLSKNNSNVSDDPLEGLGDLIGDDNDVTVDDADGNTENGDAAADDETAGDETNGDETNPDENADDQSDADVNADDQTNTEGEDNDTAAE